MLPRFIDSTTWNSGQRLDNVNRTYLVLVSDKVALQKDDCCQSIAHIFQEKMRLLPLQEVPPGGHEARPAPLGEGEAWRGSTFVPAPTTTAAAAATTTTTTTPAAATTTTTTAAATTTTAAAMPTTTATRTS